MTIKNGRLCTSKNLRGQLPSPIKMNARPAGPASSVKALGNILISKVQDLKGGMLRMGNEISDQPATGLARKFSHLRQP